MYAVLLIKPANPNLLLHAVCFMNQACSSLALSNVHACLIVSFMTHDHMDFWGREDGCGNGQAGGMVGMVEQQTAASMMSRMGTHEALMANVRADHQQLCFLSCP
jgi:hypothetical protein